MKLFYFKIDSYKSETPEYFLTKKTKYRRKKLTNISTQKWSNFLRYYGLLFHFDEFERVFYLFL